MKLNLPAQGLNVKLKHFSLKAAAVVREQSGSTMLQTARRNIVLYVHSTLHSQINLVAGFMDTLKVLKQTHKGLTSYKQEDLVRNILGRDYKAHDAQGDALALQELMITAQPPVEVKQLASFSMQNAKYRFQRMCRIDCNKPSLQSMERMTSIPKRIAETIAASGLNEEHLKRVYNAAGESGICKVFTEPVNGKPRITKNQLIIKTVANYLGKLEEQLLLQH